jgi:hypothetical protein
VLATTMKSLLLLTLSLIAGCARQPPQFIDGLREGMQESQALAALHVKATASHVLAEYSLPAGDKRPPYRERVLSIGEAECAGQKAEVWLSFYLEQLREVTCYPRDVSAMMASLRQRGVVETSKPDFEITRGGATVRGSAVGGRWGVTFSSKRLTREQQNWVKKYS